MTVTGGGQDARATVARASCPVASSLRIEDSRKAAKKERIWIFLILKKLCALAALRETF
jgi:hypothetical protein